jgi:hypothetical protein
MPGIPLTTTTTTTANRSVAELQRTLAAYAKATGNVAANPGAADGIVGTKTILAVAAVLPYLPGLPQEIRILATLAPIAVAVDSAREQAKTIITKNASTITKGVIATAAYQAYQGKPPTGQLPVTAGQAVVTMPNGVATANAIWFYDPKRLVYRIAVPRGLGSLGAPAYVEVSASSTPPQNGYQVTKNDFMVKTGQWYATPWGIGLLVGGGGAALGGFALLIRRLVR